MRAPRRFLLPPTMVVLFVATFLAYRLDQWDWEEVHHTRLVEWHELADCGDCYDGYIGPAWLSAAYVLQLPGLLPVLPFSDPLPLYIYATWQIYLADLVSICLSWFLIGALLDLKHRTAPPLATSLSLDRRA